MTLKEVRDMTLMLMDSYTVDGAEVPETYNNRLDLLRRMPTIINTCQNYLSTTASKISAVYKIAQDPIKNEIPGNMHKTIRFTGNEILLEGNSNLIYSYYFEVNGIASVRPPAGGGDLYQDENRLAAGKTIWFNADGTALYRLPAQSLDETPLTVTVYGEEKTEGIDFTVNRAEGTVTFTTAPAKLEPPENNGVVIIYYKSDAAVQGSILNCRYAEVFGGKNDVCVVIGGNEAQKNAYFWSGSNLTSDPSYFPFDYYNFAGNDDECITGFGRQQNFLVVLKERSVGKAEFGLTEIEGKNYAQLLYSPNNSKIGCDAPYTVHLVDNNGRLYAGQYFQRQ